MRGSDILSKVPKWKEGISVNSERHGDSGRSAQTVKHSTHSEFFSDRPSLIV